MKALVFIKPLTAVVSNKNYGLVSGLRHTFHVAVPNELTQGADEIVDRDIFFHSRQQKLAVECTLITCEKTVAYLLACF